MSSQRHWRPALGAVIQADGRCRFCVWAPNAKSVELTLLGDTERSIQLERGERGMYAATVDDVHPGSRYMFRLDGGESYPDPTSRAQPDGVFGASQVVDPSFHWTDEHWQGVRLQDYIVYELHIGTFTEDGTFDAAIERLDDLVDLGVTVLELMPISQFAGDRNWGYDGVFPFAVQNTYGGPDGLRRFVDACHARGLAVALDVVYNHFGPEGNCAWCYAPYTTNHYGTPWGDAINFDGPHSDEVRAYFIENALYWIHDCHIDALRLDATHFMYDFSAYSFLEELVSTVEQHREQLHRDIHLIAEDDRNDTRLTRSRQQGGIGLDAQWNDDFHHALYSLITDAGTSYFRGFGSVDSMVKALSEGFVFSGQYSEFRQRRHGTSSHDLPAHRFVVFAQNHDQVGNHAPAERLICATSRDIFKLMTGMVVLSPSLPMLFMGDEYGETALFNYFTSFEGQDLIEAIQKGRHEAFAPFIVDGVTMPDPQAISTFKESKLNWQLREQPAHRAMLNFHRELLRLRKTRPALMELSKAHMDVRGFQTECAIYMRRWNGLNEVVAAFNMGERAVTLPLPVPVGYWELLFDSTDPRWSGEKAEPKQDRVQSLGRVDLMLAPRSFVLYEKQV